MFYQSSQDEEDHEEASECGFSTHVSVTHGGHRHHEQIHTLPVGQLLEILEVFPRIARVFHLKSPAHVLSHQHGLFVNMFIGYQTIHWCTLKCLV